MGHKVEKQRVFMAKAKDKPERTKRFPVRIIRFNGRRSRTRVSARELQVGILLG